MNITKCKGGGGGEEGEGRRGREEGEEGGRGGGEEGHNNIQLKRRQSKSLVDTLLWVWILYCGCGYFIVGVATHTPVERSGTH